MTSFLFSILDTYNDFWRQHPNLLYGVAFLLGVTLEISFDPIIFLPIALIFIPLLFYKYCKTALIKRLILTLMIFFISILYTKSTFYFSEDIDSNLGIGLFSIYSIEKSPKHFGSQWIYKGCIKEWQNLIDGSIKAKNIPCTILPRLGKNEERPLANGDYILTGSIKPHDVKEYSFMMTSKEKWIPLKATFSFAEMRFIAKKTISDYIDKSIKKKRSATFLKGISTGEFRDDEMKFEFSRFGLQHIMAISGFHFAIVAGFFNLALRLFTSRKRAATILIFILCSYFLFLGSSPSVMRAWIMILIVIGGFLLERQGNGLNSLGVALFVILAIDPYMIKHVGFQFSSVVTASILINFGIFDTFIQSFFLKRELHQVVEMSFIDKHGYCIITYFRKALALTLSVNSVALPLSLYHFQKFPLMGIFYNWFFPFMVSMSIIFLILGLLFFFIPFFAGIIHEINNFYTDSMLNFAYNLPTAFDFFLRTHLISYRIVICLISVIFLWSMVTKNYLAKRGQEERSLNFL